MVTDRAGELRAPGLLQSFRAYLTTWVELLRTRLDLFSTELQEEGQRLQELVILAAAAAVCLVFGILLVTLCVVAALWEHRVIVLGAFALFYLGIGIGVGLFMRRKAKDRPKMFAATLNELAKDYQHLSS